MCDGFIGEVRAFGFGFTPLNWLPCNGTTMSIAQQSVLYAVIGTAYGGDGVQTFNLPDLRGFAPIGTGNGPGLTPCSVGQQQGTNQVTLTQATMPYHTHSATVLKAGSQTAPAYTGTPSTNTLPAMDSGAALPFNPTANSMMSQLAISVAGSGQPHENRQPFLALNYCICIDGVFPPRP